MDKMTKLKMEIEMVSVPSNPADLTADNLDIKYITPNGEVLRAEMVGFEVETEEMAKPNGWNEYVIKKRFAVLKFEIEENATR